MYFSCPKKLKKVAINGVLPLKATRRDASAEFESSWASEHQGFFDSFICIRYAAPPYSADTLIIASVYEGWVKTVVLFIGN